MEVHHINFSMATPIITARVSLGSREVAARLMDYSAVRHYVESKLSEGLLNEWKEFILEDERSQRMWSKEQPKGFERRMITLAIYKDLSGLGYQKILNSINIGFKLQAKSFSHNTKLIRKILVKWAKKQIENEGEKSWNKHKHLFPKKKKLNKVNLLMDSSDFRLSGKSSISRKDSKWSYKLNAPGQRFQLLCDARGKVQRLWGGYSPKIYDGNWLEIMVDDLGNQFKGAQIIADTHYELGNKIMKRFGHEKKVGFFTPIAESRGRKKKVPVELEGDLSYQAVSLTKEQKTWNNAIKHVRARVESPFGLIKTKWNGLKLPFFENEEQQTFLVFIAVATHNYQIEH
jgi:hypothetical protein